MPWRSPPDRSPTVESASMPAPRKPICSSSRRLATSFWRLTSMKPKPVGDLAADEQVAPERLLVGERLLLMHRLDPQVVRAAHRIALGVDQPVADVEAAAGRLEHAGDDLDQGRLAGAVVADQPDDLVGADLEVDVLERDHVAERHVDVLHPHRMDIVARAHAVCLPALDGSARLVRHAPARKGSYWKGAGRQGGRRDPCGIAPARSSSSGQSNGSVSRSIDLEELRDLVALLLAVQDVGGIAGGAVLAALEHADQGLAGAVVQVGLHARRCRAARGR